MDEAQESRKWLEFEAPESMFGAQPTKFPFTKLAF